MRQETNNEIDLLLRRMGRHDDGDLGQHLDGDELSSYAQNALPAAARARYTQHLAECSTCRKLVTELSLSLGASAAVAAPVETVSVPGGLKKFLASLFSPMVLRYAVPALGLIVVAVIGFLALRQRQDSVALRMADQKERVPITSVPSAPAPSEAPAAGFVDPKNESASAKPVEQPKEIGSRNGIVAGDTAPSTSAPVAVAPPVRDVKRADESKATTEAEPPPPAPAKVDVATDTEEQKKREAAAKKQETVAVATKEAEIATSLAKERGANYQRNPQPASQAKEENKPKDTVRGNAAVGGVARVFSAGEADKNEADTRTVAGRRFRKERGIWTDTAYDSSTATVNMARGSDQFKALVADEPEIKKIAEQLDGEVIVVWKGRAYRIR
jgi:hypothetical protein